MDDALAQPSAAGEDVSVEQARSGSAYVEGIAQRQGTAEDGHGSIRIEAIYTAFASLITSAGRRLHPEDPQS